MFHRSRPASDQEEGMTDGVQKSPPVTATVIGEDTEEQEVDGGDHVL